MNLSIDYLHWYYTAGYIAIVLASRIRLNCFVTSTLIKLVTDEVGVVVWQLMLAAEHVGLKVLIPGLFLKEILIGMGNGEMVEVITPFVLSSVAIAVGFTGGSIDCIIAILAIESCFIVFNYNLYYFEEPSNFDSNINTIGCYLPIHFTCASMVVVIVPRNYTTNCLGLNGYQNS